MEDGVDSAARTNGETAMSQLRRDAPAVLYKYRGTIEFDRDLKCLLRDRQLWLAAPQTLNDAFDCFPALELPDPASHQAIIDREVASAPAHLAADWRRRCELILRSPAHQARYQDEYYTADLGRIGVVSFSAPRDQLVLWAHYGGNFAGFAVGYRAQTTSAGEAV